MPHIDIIVSYTTHYVKNYILRRCFLSQLMYTYYCLKFFFNFPLKCILLAYLYYKYIEYSNTTKTHWKPHTQTYPYKDRERKKRVINVHTRIFYTISYCNILSKGKFSHYLLLSDIIIQLSHNLNPMFTSQLPYVFRHISMFPMVSVLWSDKRRFCMFCCFCHVAQCRGHLASV
jgi:hypothetical protein